MAREIRFRAWNPHLGLMSYNFEEINITGHDIVGEVVGGSINATYKDSKSWKDAPIMQFTGLRDKKETPIYEGDILHDYHERRHVIEYFQPDARYISIYADEYVRGNWDDSNEAIGLVWVNCEVVGNIYEHPNLLNNADR